MRSILEEFAYGNIPLKNQGFTSNSMYGQAVHSVSANEEKLLHILSSGEKIMFQKYIDAQGEVNELTAIRNFIYGYKLGVLMTAEAFSAGSELVVGGEYNSIS